MAGDALLNALRRKAVAYRGAGRDELAERVEARIAELESSAEPAEPEPVEPETRGDGVHPVGGGWHEVVVDGEVVDKVRGADAAQEAYEVYQEANNGD